MSSGWICLHRSITDHWLWQDSKKFKWWVTILIRVNHEEKKVPIGNKLYVCGRGESLMSLSTWGEIFECNKKTVRSFFLMLQEDGMLETQVVGSGKHKTTKIIVCNYDTYQDKQPEEETQEKRKTDHKGNTRATQGGSLEQREAVITKQLNNYNNEEQLNKKKEKIEKEIYEKGNQESLLFDDDGEQILKKEEKPKEKTSAKKEKVDWKEGFEELFKIQDFSTSWDEYLKARKTKATPRAKQLALKKLVDMSGNDIDLSIKILEQSIMNGYQGLFPLKNQNNGYTQQKPKPTSQLERTTGKTREELDAEWSDDHTTAYLNQVLAEQAKYR